MSNEMKRLVDEPIDPKLSSILRSAQGDVPPATRRKQDRILAAASATVSFDVPSSPSASTWGWRHARGIGLAGVLVIVSAGVVSRWSLFSTKAPSASAPPASQVDVPGPESRNNEPFVASVGSAPDPTPSVSVDDLPAARPSGSVSAVRKQPAASATVNDELALVDAGRVALAHGDARAALARVTEYRARFPSPRFADEVDALEVSALVALGERTAARSKAERFAAAHPDSPYLQRVRSVVRTTE